MADSPTSWWPPGFPFTTSGNDPWTKVLTATYTGEISYDASNRAAKWPDPGIWPVQPACVGRGGPRGRHTQPARARRAATRRAGGDLTQRRAAADGLRPHAAMWDTFGARLEGTRCAA